jgi:hypothetical protein
MDAVTLTVTTAQLIITLPATANEKDSTLVKQGKISLSHTSLKEVIVTLISSDTTEIIVPNQIIIPKGELSVTFNIAVLDDDIVDFSQSIVVKASATDWVTGNASIIVLDDDVDWKQIDLPFAANIDFNSIWGSSDENIFIVGSPGTILHYDGTEWQNMPLPTDLPQDLEIMDVYGNAYDNVIAVGNHTTVLKYDGSQWQALTSTDYGGYKLNDVWVLGNNIYTVGDKFLSYENGVWSESTKSGAPFNSLWGTIETSSEGYTATTLFAAGNNIISKDWQPESIAISVSYQSIWGLSFDNIYAVGGNEIIHRTNTVWSVIDNPHKKSTDIYTDIWASSENDILVVGTNGTILNNIDNQWVQMQTGTTRSLNAIWGSSSQNVYAAGASGTILRARPRNVSNNRPPVKPIAITPKDEITVSDTNNITLESLPFTDPDMDQHKKTYWKVRRADQDYYHPDYPETFSHDVANSDSVNMTQHSISGVSTGMKYYWKVGYMDDSEGQSEISWSDEFSFKVGQTETDDKTPTIPPGEDIADYKMISFTYWPDDPQLTSICADLKGNYNNELNKVGTYLPSRNGYVEGESVKIVPGRAYWFLARNGLDLNVTGVKVNTSETIEVPLWYSNGNGWNMIGPPNDNTYQWATISVIVYDKIGNITDGPHLVSSDEAGKYIDSRLWGWEGSGYEDDKTELRPYSGYWVRVKQANVSLQFSVSAIVHHSNKRVPFVKKLIQAITPEPLQAVSTEEPPMPIGLNASEDSNNDKCFICIVQQGSGYYWLTYICFFLTFYICIFNNAFHDIDTSNL